MGQRSVGASTDRVRVLLVENDVVEVELLEASMRDRGMVQLHSEVATTMAEAVAVLDNAPFDVVLLDLSLPDSQGLSTVTTLLEAHPSIPVVVLTSADDDLLAAAAIEAGAQDYLVKGSVTPEVLGRAVRSARERRSLLAALELREHRFRAMADAAQDAIYAYRILPSFEFEYLNPAVARLTGFPLQEFHANPNLYLERVHREDVTKLDLDQLAQTGMNHSVTVRLQRADGEWVVLEDHRVPMVEAGVVVGVQGVVRDVTAQQRITRALHDALRTEQHAAEELRATNDVKGQFLQAVSHELRTPLTAIIGFSETLVNSSHQLVPEQMRSFHERILGNALRLQVIMGDLLDLERLTHAELRVHRVETDVTAVAQEISRSLAMGTRGLAVEGTACVASVDRAMVERIIRNLLANTIKHTPPSTSVTVRCTRDDDVARISVIDDGPGIPEGSWEHAFEPFWQGKAMQGSPSPGTGVGLAIVRQFAAVHGGHAWLDTTPGGGTTVHVELAVRAAATADGRDPADELPAPMQTPTHGDATWRYLPLEHRRSLRRAMTALLDATSEQDATDVIMSHLLRTGAEPVDGSAERTVHATVMLHPDIAPVRISHHDETILPTLAGQVEMLTYYAGRALATCGLRPAPAPPDTGDLARPSRTGSSPAGDTPAALHGEAVVSWATRGMIEAGRVDELIGILVRATHALGGTVLPARLEDEETLPLDLTLGAGEPLLPAGETGSTARRLLRTHLPGLVADARRAADRLVAAASPESPAPGHPFVATWKTHHDRI